MRISAVTLARTIALIDVLDLNPRGHVPYSGIVNELVGRYGFQKWPQSLQEFDEQKGVEFLAGQWKDVAIDKFVIFNTGIVAETRASTDVSRQIIEDALATGRESLGLSFEEGMIKRWGYVSDVTFYSDVSLLAVFSHPLARIAEAIGHEVSKATGENLEFQPISLSIGHDPLVRKYTLAPFSLARRVEVPFSENKYFSEAPLPTDIHIKLLEQFERDVLHTI